VLVLIGGNQRGESRDAAQPQPKENARQGCRRRQGEIDDPKLRYSITE
jgi:hypothetical protein